jgi:hypothetical protein
MAGECGDEFRCERLHYVDNHACILIRIKNILGIQKKVTTESDHCPEAAAGQSQRTVSCLQDRLRTGGPKQEILLSLDILQLHLQLRDTTPRYHCYYYYRLPRKTRLPRLLLLLLPSPRSFSPSEPRTSRCILSRIDILYKDYQPPSTPSLLYYSH